MERDYVIGRGYRPTAAVATRPTDVCTDHRTSRAPAKLTRPDHPHQKSRRCPRPQRAIDDDYHRLRPPIPNNHHNDPRSSAPTSTRSLERSVPGPRRHLPADSPSAPPAAASPAYSCFSKSPSSADHGDSDTTMLARKFNAVYGKLLSLMHLRSQYGHVSLSGEPLLWTKKNRGGRRTRPIGKVCGLLMIAVLIVLGIVQLFSLLLTLSALIYPDHPPRMLKAWRKSSHRKSEALNHWPTDLTRDIQPIPCHSHNDYWRPVPLYSAISAGCTGIEADVWAFDDELFVGHNTVSLTRDRTLRALYIDPLVEILDRQNSPTEFSNTNTTKYGIFDTKPEQTVVLLIDFKNSGEAVWPLVKAQLEPLRSRHYLTYFNGTKVIEGPITVVGTGNAPFDLMTADPNYRDVFFDAPLDQFWEGSQGWPEDAGDAPGELLFEGEGSVEEAQGQGPPALPPPGEDGHPWGVHRHEYTKESHVPDPNGDLDDHPDSSNLPDIKPQKRTKRDNAGGQGRTGTSGVTNANVYNRQNSYYASVSFRKSIGFIWRNRLSRRQMGLIRGQIRGAHRRGLKVRYWSFPGWPIGLRKHLWDVLVREGVDMLNVDDLKAVSERDWDDR
ncbi:MAG: hypothetical protein M1819_006982 [Sarea resinae]|nr:MAG: hypothetical protein M1819_006982 [Sarea resinae]